ncbi:solute carrier family 22 member 13-like [Acanthaster planci]|uniref:Solute carrier family 22 member 13-like n=1 Tax=Acanthaster planci TaxID=133434 RepID=A0A8B7ZQ94_ACAPL|nr:solute carrier family 22 member 13-like [Acanthaster planci]
MKLEEITALLGNFGRYQILLIAYASILSCIGCFVTLSHVFFAAGTDHWCSVLPHENCSSWPVFQDNCTEVKKAMFLPPSQNDSSKYPYSNCDQWALPSEYVFDPYAPLADVDNFTYSAVPCKSGWVYDTSQYKTTIISEFDLVCVDNDLPSFSQSIYFVGFLVSSIIVGTLSDWLGRKKALSLSLLLWVVGFIVTTFSVNIYMYMAFRFISGFGEYGAYLSSFVLAVENVPDSWRTAVTMLFGITYAVGYFFLATAAMYVREWRPLCLIMSLATVPLLFPLPFVQESISWLVSKDKLKEADAVIRRVAKFNKKTLPDVLFDKEDDQNEMEARESAIPPSFIDLYRTPNMAVKTINMQYNWLVNSLVYYGLSLSTGDLGVDDYWAFFVSGAVEIPALVYATFGVEWFGRKWNTAVLELIGGVACLVAIFIPIGIWRTVVSMIGKFCISATFSIIYLYSSELFPTPIRAVGIGMCSVSSRIGGIISPLVLLLGRNVPSIVFGSSAIAAGILVFFLPETKGRKLPQTLKEAEAMGKCKCMTANVSNESVIELDEVDLDKEGVFAISNAAFDHGEEKKCRDFSQQFTRNHRESSHM